MRKCEISRTAKFPKSTADLPGSDEALLEVCDVPNRPSQRIFSGKVQLFGKGGDSPKRYERERERGQKWWG